MHRFIEGVNNQRHTQIVSYEENEEFVDNLVRCKGDRVVFEGGGMGGARVEGVEKASQVLVQTSNKFNSSKRHPQHFFSTDYKHTNTTLPLDTRGAKFVSKLMIDITEDECMAGRFFLLILILTFSS